ncbi:hypothetical protein AGMMS49992_02520 [Clostridia bacterium]|nr:hypothetical protein AGMMS49992_02520 [Clostridia bacterium]
MGRKIEISDGNILKLQEAITKAQPDDVIYITKDLTLNLDQYVTPLPTATTSTVSIPFSIIGQPSASKGSNAKIHIGSTGNPLTVPLVSGKFWEGKHAQVTFKNISLHMDLTPTESHYGGYVCFGEHCVFANCDAEGSIISDSDSINEISPFIGRSVDNLDMDNCTNNCIVSLPSCESVGGFVGSTAWGNANIVDCVNNVSIRGLSYIAGIVGMIAVNNLYIKGCVNKGNIDAYETNAAGISGSADCWDNCVIRNCYNSGIITTYNTEEAEIEGDATWVGLGGILGQIQCELPNGGLYSCVNYGNIIGTELCKHLGGIVGHLEGGEVVDCVNFGSVQYGGMIGGIVGGAASSYTSPINLSLLKRCVDKGSIYGTWRGVGGIAGSVYGFTTVEDCRVCAMVDTIEADTEEVGGIVGMVQWDYNIGRPDREEWTTIRNNVACAEFVKVNHDSLADNGLDYVHRILGRFLPDQFNPDIVIEPWNPWNTIADKFLLLENNYAMPTVTLVGNNSNILEGYEYDHFYNIQSSGVYPEPGAVVKHSDPDYGANRLNGADVAEFDPAHPLPNSLLECMYGYIPPIITATLCGFNHGDGVRPGCFTVGLYADDGTTLLAKATNDSKGIMKLPLISPSLAHPGSKCFWVRRVRNSNNHVLNYVESFPVRVWVTQDDKGKLNHYVCYSMMLGEPNFLI